MSANSRQKWRAALACTATLLSASLLALAPAGPIHAAEQPCQNGGAYIIFARGSSAKFGSDDAKALRDHLRYLMPTATFAELGNLDESKSEGEDPENPWTEYPAVAVANLSPNYGQSVETGARELIAHLNHRYTPGPVGKGCMNEVAILGGYSQGADAVGWALEWQGPEGLNQSARDHIAYAALYGDPRYNRRCDRERWWIRGDSTSPCSTDSARTDGYLGARDPYARDEYQNRFGSWCSGGDGFCNGSAVWGNHGEVYRQYWYQQSAREIAQATAERRLLFLNQGSGVTNATFIGSDALGTDQGLFKNQYALSTDGRFVLILQNDCNLVIYGPRYQPIWSTGPKPGCDHMVLQQDGNWVMRTSTWQPLWSTNQVGSGGVIIRIQNDGNLVQYNAANQPVWSTNTQQPVAPLTYVGQDHLTPDHGIFQNQYLRSADKRYFLLMQQDGNLVLYGPGQHILWQTGSDGSGAYLFMLQLDGNLVLRKPDGSVAFTTGTISSPSRVVVQNDGNVVEYNTSGVLWWSSRTYGRI